MWHCKDCGEDHPGAWDGSNKCPNAKPQPVAAVSPDLAWRCSKCSTRLTGPFCDECDGEHGVSLSEGVKFDTGKGKWHLLPWDAVAEVVRVFTKGAEKYEDRNWEKGMAWSRVFNSTQRHLTDWFQKRQTLDPDGTGLRNIAQAAWGCLVLLAWELRGDGTDDRPGTS